MRRVSITDIYDMRAFSFRCFIKKAFIFTQVLGFSFSLYAQTRPLYTLPSLTQHSQEVTDFLVGTDAGLFCIENDGSAMPLWAEGKVNQIERTSDRWYIVSNKGIFTTKDLKEFKSCNKGLPSLKIKEYDGKTKSFVTQVQLLKDFCVDPLNSNICVTATKDDVFLSRDGGSSWKNIGSMSSNTNGIKSVAVATIGGETVVFMSHSIYGFSYYMADRSNASWTDVSAGFRIMPTVKQTDEVSDILPVVFKQPDGTFKTEIYVTQSFLPNLYHFNFETKRAELLYQGDNAADTFDGLCQSNNRLLFTTLGKLMVYNISTASIEEIPQTQYRTWRKSLYSALSAPNAAYIAPSYTGLETAVKLKELWLLRPDVVLSPWGEKANGKKGIYVATNYVTSLNGINKYKKIIKDNGLNTIVVDMKDDYGRLRYDPDDPVVKEKANVSGYKINTQQFVSEFKKDGIYLVARIVVFKDKNLWSYQGGKYAVWDKVNNKRWLGTKGMQDVTDADGNVTGQEMTYYDENWVDPYSEEVWEYNVAIARELISKGFDEIQFDYIRFPTDGYNIGNATFRWRDSGMDKESALTSFLSYARKNIDAPIGIDIYGANGWYRSGARTGQDVELMSEYVDVICPMYYPSHFEQNFLEYAPVLERPYRIYFYGSYRNTVIGRNKIISRPWVQAFYLPVRYDRYYYNEDYVKREIYGVRDGVDRGYLYWNNIGRYDDISCDPPSDSLSPWYSDEGELQNRKPAFSSGGEQQKEEGEDLEDTLGQLKVKQKEMQSIWDTVSDLSRGEDDIASRSSAVTNLLQISGIPF